MLSQNAQLGPKTDTGLKQLSQFLSIEAKNLTPNIRNLPVDLSRRASSLWYIHFSSGVVDLAHGGVEDSFIELKDLENKSMETFNMYSHPDSPKVTQELMKRFLIEEGALLEEQKDKFSVSFCLGSHEGVIRVARCLYASGTNEAMLFPEGGYGLFAAALSTILPVSFRLHLINCVRDNGEKISLLALARLVKRYPKARTLFIELKTTAGAVYTKNELEFIIKFCKKHKIFILFDATHFNMHFQEEYALPNVTQICQKLDFHEIAVFYTGSKTYGLERARIGLIILDKAGKTLSSMKIDDDLSRSLGFARNNMPEAVAIHLFNTPLLKRQNYTEKCRIKQRYNMNLMIAYIEGTNSPNIDEDLRENIKNEIQECYGIPLLKIIYKPKCGIHLKINICQLKDKYFTNIRMFNAEIFCYALNKLAGVVTIHSYCIMDLSGDSLRLCYSIKRDVHAGMKAIHHFVSSLTDKPTLNKYLPTVQLAEDLINPRKVTRLAPLNRMFKSTNHPSMVANSQKANVVVDKVDNRIRARL